MAKLSVNLTFVDLGLQYRASNTGLPFFEELSLNIKLGLMHREPGTGVFKSVKVSFLYTYIFSVCSI